MSFGEFLLFAKAAQIKKQKEQARKLEELKKQKELEKKAAK